MLVLITEDRMGNVHLSCVNKRWARKFGRHMEEVGGFKNHDGSAFLQQGMGAEEFKEELKPGQARDIEHGWDLRIRMDPWTYGHLLGWDAHTVVW